MSSPIQPRKLDPIPEVYSDSSSDESQEYINLTKDPEQAFQLYFPIAERTLLTSGSISRIEMMQRYEITRQVADRILDTLRDRFLNTREYHE